MNAGSVREVPLDKVPIAHKSEKRAGSIRNCLRYNRVVVTDDAIVCDACKALLCMLEEKAARMCRVEA